MLPRIKRVEPGKIHINDEIIDTDFFLHAGGIEKRSKSRHVTKDDIERLLLHEPEAVIIGTGFKNNVKVDDKIKEYLNKMGIELYLLSTPDALESFKNIARSGKKVVAKIHVSG